MTKYIRTKTKIEKVGTTLNDEELFDYLKQFDNYKDDLVKVADTIEELCDGYVFKDTKANELHFAQKGKEDGMFILGALLFIETVRCFIETDKGLIYVAKMNNEGELELL